MALLSRSRFHHLPRRQERDGGGFYVCSTLFLPLPLNFTDMKYKVYTEGTMPAQFQIFMGARTSPRLASEDVSRLFNLIYYRVLAPGS